MEICPFGPIVWIYYYIKCWNQREKGKQSGKRLFQACNTAGKSQPPGPVGPEVLHLHLDL